MPDREYNVEVETQFNREQLLEPIPDRLNQLLEAIRGYSGTIEDWYANLLSKIVLAVALECQELFETIEKRALSSSAWHARNLLELWIWIEYCSPSQANARRFHEDALRDLQGFAESLSKMHATAKVKNEFETAARKKLAEMALTELGITFLDSKYLRVGEAAKSLGLVDWYAPCNAHLSKFAHPTAGLVVGIMH